MNKILDDIKYSKTHEWARVMIDGSITIGISDHAQHQLGDMVFVEPPEVGRTLKANEACAVVESVKAASDVYSPIAGEVVEINEKLADKPELLNEDPYGEGWIMRVNPSTANDVDQLLDARAYEELLRAEA